MRIENEFTVSVPLERAWEVLTDLEGIAPCMPGAQLTGVEGETYSGKLRVKVGPVISDFAGTATFTSKDETAHRAVIDAKGRDARGAGNASASIAASLRPDGDRTVVSVETDLRIAGKLAQFGNRMIAQVSEKLLGQFVDCLESKLAAEPTSTTATESPADTSVGLTGDTSGAASGAVSDGTTGGASGAASAEMSGGASGGAAGGASGAASASDGITGGASGRAAAGSRTMGASAEPEPVDLVKLAGGTVAKRVVPLVIAVVVIALVIWYLIKR
jgi:carbon monoxide dehydrogenase subunit G